MKNYKFWIRFLVATLILWISASTFSQQPAGSSPAELRQLQTRQFKTNNVDKVTNIVQEAFMDMGYKGGGNSYWHEEGGYIYKAQVSIGPTPDNKYVIVRIDFGSLLPNAPQKGSEVYSELFSAIGKSAFLDSQRLPLEQIK